MSWNERCVCTKFKVHTHRGTRSVTIEDGSSLAKAHSNERSYAREQDAGKIGRSIRKADKTVL